MPEVVSPHSRACVRLPMTDGTGTLLRLMNLRLMCDAPVIASVLAARATDILRRVSSTVFRLPLRLLHHRERFGGACEPEPREVGPASYRH